MRYPLQCVCGATLYDSLRVITPAALRRRTTLALSCPSADDSWEKPDTVDVEFGKVRQGTPCARRVHTCAKTCILLSCCHAPLLTNRPLSITHLYPMHGPLLRL